MIDLFVKPTDEHQFLDPSSFRPYIVRKQYHIVKLFSPYISRTPYEYLTVVVSDLKKFYARSTLRALQVVLEIMFIILITITDFNTLLIMS